MQKVICLWSSPRNCSTALMYAFAQRNDVKVFDEVLYAHYLFSSEAQHPGRSQILKAQDKDGEKVIENIILKSRDKISFHKLMTHFLINLDLSFLKKVINIILIRRPEEIIYSYNKVISEFTMNDIGIKQQYDLYHELLRINNPAIVLDSRYLLQNPEKVLNKLCELLSIPFDKQMLSWEKGGRKEDGVWAKYWYKNLHQSIGFLPYIKKDIVLSENNLNLAKECAPYYDFLTDKSIKI